MRFDIVTLFPELFTPHLSHGVTRRAFQGGPIQVKLWPLREHAHDAYRRVDDRPFGGGPGMVMLAEPLERALEAVRVDRGEATPSEVIHFTPSGRRLDQATISQIARSAGAVVLCGRYEGIDQRVIDRYVTLELSLGDFILSGGELPALVLLDAVARLQDGVLPAPSHQQESFSDGLLEAPTYSRPEALADGRHVPEVLLSGHHAHIARWRRDRSLELTACRRPDLIERARRDGRLDAHDERVLAALTRQPSRPL